MNTKGSPRGLHPWGLSHTHKFGFVGIDENNRKIYHVSCLYTYKMRLPYYISELFKRRMISHGIIDGYMKELTFQIEKLVGYRVVEIVYQRDGIPYITVQLETHEPYQKEILRRVYSRVYNVVADTRNALKEIFLSKVATSIKIDELRGIRFLWLRKYLRSDNFLNAAATYDGKLPLPNPG